MDYSKIEVWAWKGLAFVLSSVTLFVLASSAIPQDLSEDKGIVYVGKDGTILDFDTWAELLSYLTAKAEAQGVKDE